jgi:hypothetical protein
LFISYNWAKKKEIKLLSQRLLSRGYTNWLDVDRLGIGTSLDAEIQKGIKGCQVLICCITEYYIKSKTSEKELALAKQFNKPIIPIMLEKIVWPPTGPSSAILAPLTFVTFTRKDGVEQNSWNGAGTTELLTRIKQHIKKPEKKEQPLESIQAAENQSSTCVIL